jgi:hypothetical protein
MLSSMIRMLSFLKGTQFALTTTGHKNRFGIKRIETDCSRALISGVLQALQIGPTIDYLNDIWNSLVSGNIYPCTVELFP